MCFYSFVLTKEGKIFSCGLSSDGQTGRGHFNNESEMGVIGGDISQEKIVKVSSKSDCVLALNGKVPVLS